MPIFVNTLSDCFRYGAWYDHMFRSLNFCPATAERANTAFGSVVHHEFGHHIVSSGFSGQDQYGEGMADTVAMLYAKDPRGMIGYDRYQCDTWRHSADNSCQFTDPPNIEIEITFDPFTAQSNNTPGFAIDDITVHAYPYAIGDVNHSGRVDIVDALLIAQHYVHLNPADVDLSVADVNLDGAINIVDALLIAQYYVGIITALPLPPDAIAHTETQPVTNMDEAQAVIEDAISLP